MNAGEVFHAVLFVMAVALAGANFLAGITTIRNEPLRAGAHFSITVLLVYCAWVIV